MASHADLYEHFWRIFLEEYPEEEAARGPAKRDSKRWLELDDLGLIITFFLAPSSSVGLGVRGPRSTDVSKVIKKLSPFKERLELALEPGRLVERPGMTLVQHHVDHFPKAPLNSQNLRKQARWLHEMVQRYQKALRNTVAGEASPIRNDLHPNCVYTIVKKGSLDACAAKGESYRGREGKPWTKAKAWLDEAAATQKRLPILFSDAADTRFLHYWGYLDAISIDDNGTEYRVDRLRRLRRKYLKEILVLFKNGKQIDRHFIRPYALCEVPPFLVEKSRHETDAENVHDYIRNFDEILANSMYTEGARELVYVNRFERSKAARDRCLAHYGHCCSVCDLEFGKLYGKIGKGFIHVHHLVALSSIETEYEIDPIKDLRPVCPNCHAMLHRGDEGNDLITIERLRKIVSKYRVEPRR